MAETKKPVAKKPVAVKPVEEKAAKVVEAKETVKTEAKKEPAKKAPAKKAAPAAKKEVAKAVKETVKKVAEKKAPAKKAAKEVVTVQFADKSYTTEDFVKIAKDVWVYDLNQKATDFKTVELYVKPEESLVYYVINGDVTGSFAI